MAELPDDLERLENIAADLRARLTRIEDRIRRLKDAQWREFQKERAAALGVAVGLSALEIAELIQAIERHIDGWRSATFGWQGDADPAIEAQNRAAAVQAHAAECLRRIRATLAAGVGGTDA